MNVVPPEFRDLYDPVFTGDPLFGSVTLAGCRQCGALIHPAAIERHSRFHEAIFAGLQLAMIANGDLV